MFSNNEFLDSIIRLLIVISGIVTAGVLAVTTLAMYLVALLLIKAPDGIYYRYMIFVWKYIRLFLKTVGEEDIADEEIANLKKEFEES